MAANPSEPQPSPPREFDEEEIDLSQILAALLSGKWLIGGVAAAVVVLGIGYATLATPIYRADVLLQVEKTQPTLPGVEEMEEMLGGGQSSPAETQIQILRSRSVIGEAVDKLDLDIKARPHYFPVFGGFLARHHNPGTEPADPLWGLEGFAWGGERLAVNQLVIAKPLRGEPLTLVAGEGDTYTVRGPEGQTLLHGTVGKPAHSPRGNPHGEPLVQMFVAELRARPGTEFALVKQSQVKAVETLQNQLSISEQGDGTGIIRMALEGPDPSRIKATLNTVANIFQRQNVERRSKQAQKSLEFLNKQLPELRNRVEAASQRLNNFRQTHKALDLGVETEKLLKQMVDIDKRLSELELKRSELSQSYGAQHPKMEALTEQKQDLSRTKAKLEGRIKELPDTQQKLLRLQRELEVQQTLYTSLLNRAQELRMVKAGTVGNVRILDYAYTPVEPVEPRKTLVAALSGILGLFLGVGVLFVRNALRTTLDDPRVLENRLGLAVYAVIPHSRHQERSVRRAARHGTPIPILAKERPQEVTVESLRSLRTSLHFALLQVEHRIIALTGPSPGTGKTFLSMNTAYLLAEAGQRTLLIDADLRRGHLHNYTGFDRVPGLSDLILSGERWSGCFWNVHENLDLLTTGTLPPNPAELLMGSRFTELLRQLEESYDLILVDTPPIMAVTDATIVGAQAGAVLMVVRAGYNRLPEVEEAIRRSRQHGVPISGILFNDLRTESAQGRYYSSYYYYNYEYKSSPGA